MGLSFSRPQLAFPDRSTSVGCRASEEDEILVWVRDYESRGTPWFLLERLMDGDSCSLITQEELFDFVRGGGRYGSGEQDVRAREYPRRNTGSQTSRKLSRALSRKTCA